MCKTATILALVAISDSGHSYANLGKHLRVNMNMCGKHFSPTFKGNFSHGDLDLITVAILA